MDKSRLENVVKNSGASIINRLAEIIIRFIIRTLFIRVLGDEYTGISSLFTDILSVLSLVEMGLDSSMIFSLYKPLADNDEKHIAALMNFYRAAFTVIGIAVLVSGIVCIPVLQFIVKDVPSIKEDIRIIFLMYVINSASSYFYIYKSILIRADQKSRIISNVRTTVSILECAAEVILILAFKEFFIYLIVSLIATLIRNFWLSHKAEKIYPEYLSNREARIAPHEKRTLFNNIFALIVYNLAAVILSSTDSIFVSAFVGTAQVAVVGNFTLITNSVKRCIKMVVSATRPSVGNLVATGTVEKQRIMFDRINFLTFWIACFCSTCLFVLLNPFIGDIWINESYKLNNIIVVPIILNFYLSVMSYAIGTFRSINGLFTQGWYRPAVMSVLNVALDYFMGKKWGLPGIYIATSLSLLSTQVWYDPFVVFKHVFRQNPWKYYCDYIWQICFTICCCGICFFLGEVVPFSNRFVVFGMKMLIAICIPNIIICVLFWRTDNFAYAKGILFRLLRKRKN